MGNASRSRLLFEDGLRHHLAGRIEGAIANYRRAIELRPGFADAHSNLGAALAAKLRCREAIGHYRTALALNPESAGVHYNLAILLVAQGRTDEAIAHYRLAVAQRPGYAEAHNNLANLLEAQGRPDEALAHYERAVAIDPRHAEAHNNLGNLLRENGNLSAALDHYDRAVGIAPRNPVIHFHRAEVKTFRIGDPDLAAMENLEREPNLPAEKRPYIHFALAKALEDCGDYARSFAQLTAGNTVKRRQISYDEEGVAQRFRRVAALFDKALLDRLSGNGDPSDAPIFVVGMPRSGTTLIEQILASHPQVHGAGELLNLEQAAAGVSRIDGDSLRPIANAYLISLPALPPGKTRIVDKLPANFFAIGLIRLILPNAKILHCFRNPIDTCVSCYSRLFANGQYFSYDLAELGRFYRRYAQLMAHWRSALPPGVMLEVAYEDVVSDLEGQARRMLAHCGLSWDDRCRDFHRTVRPVKTASAVQVRQPLFKTSVQRWRKYEPWLGPLLRELSVAEDFHHIRAADAG